MGNDNVECVLSVCFRAYSKTNFCFLWSCKHCYSICFGMLHIKIFLFFYAMEKKIPKRIISQSSVMSACSRWLYPAKSNNIFKVFLTREHCEMHVCIKIHSSKYVYIYTLLLFKNYIHEINTQFHKLLINILIVRNIFW